MTVIGNLKYLYSRYLKSGYLSFGLESTLKKELVIENVLRSTLSYPNETSKECIQFLNKFDSLSTSM
jgi:hypothetical protein